MSKNKPGSPHLRFSLIENAYDFLDDALSNAKEAEDSPERWKFAVLHVVSALELLLKQRLLDEHRLLIYENVDRPTRTASLELVLRRLQAVDVSLDAHDISSIERAIKWRNTITHYEVDLHLQEVRANFIALFEFLNAFHVEHFADDLTAHVSEANQKVAARMFESFRNEFAIFDGERMHRSWPTKLLAAQETLTVTVEGVEFQRIRWGGESHWAESTLQGWVPKERCRDCACRLGDLHGPGCCVEECPRCGGQFTYCDCPFDDSDFWNLFDDPSAIPEPQNDTTSATPDELEAPEQQLETPRPG